MIVSKMMDFFVVQSTNPVAFPKTKYLSGKSKIINKAIMDIGMGWYQWQLFCLCGFGWLADK